MAKTLEQIRAEGFNKLDAATMFDYLKEHATKDQIKAFMQEAYVYTKAVPVRNAEGEAVFTKAGRYSKKTGKEITPRQKNKLEAITDEKEIAKLKAEGKKPRFRTLEAKRFFCATFCPDLLPKKSDKPKAEAKTASFLAEFGDLL